jgi:pimeloyl-ACP methyl ester carboxylesterase
MGYRALGVGVWFLWLCLAPRAVVGADVAPPVGPGGWSSQTTEPPPEQVAGGHLRRARELLATGCDLEKRCDRHAIDAYYAACEEAWNAVWTCPESPEILCNAAEIYADTLQGLLESARCHGRLSAAGLVIGPPRRQILVPIETRALPIDASVIDTVEAACPPGDRRISRRHVRGGFGLPVTVRLAAGQEGSVWRDFAPRRRSIAATAVLRFALPGGENRLEKFAGPLALDHAPAILDLANPQEIAAVHVGGAHPHLAADLSAPLLDMLAAMPRTGAVQGFVQPFGSGDTQPRLEMLQPHRPGRIPVVFIHGLASDEGTWFDLLNELQAWPTFQRRFEPWVYHYPTGASFLQSAAVLRRKLAEAVQRLDPEGRDPALQSLILVGHSMGGLHAKLQVVDSGNAMWNAIACRPADEIWLPPEHKQQIRQAYFFRPLPFVKRVVFIATPHGGSPLASLGVGRVASLTVRQPPEMTALHERIVRANPGALRPEYERRLPTTVDVLEPDSTILMALRDLRVSCWVTTHSVIGHAHAVPCGGDGDCIVPVSSARIPGVSSEVMVPATHTRVHHQPATVAEVERILLQHLRETGLDGQRPATVQKASTAAAADQTTGRSQASPGSFSYSLCGTHSDSPVSSTSATVGQDGRAAATAKQPMSVK